MLVSRNVCRHRDVGVRAAVSARSLLASISRAPTACAIVLGASAFALAVDGLAVSMRTTTAWSTISGGDIVLYEVRNNDVHVNRVLYDGHGGAAGSISAGRYPVISSDGTRVAFFRNTNVSGSFVSLVSTSGDPVADIVTLPATTGFDGKGCMDWPRGPWIYYNMGSGTDGSMQLRRVNADDPSRNEPVVTFGYDIWQWQMSAAANRMHIRFSGNDGAPIERARYALPGDGTLTDWNRCGWGVGCGTTISPSGTWLQHIEGRHTWFALSLWDSARSTKYASSVQCLDWNQWTVNALELNTMCNTEDGSGTALINTGCETEGNRWSCNSDKWVCLQTGLPQDYATSGRYAFCGSNQTLVNWVDSITVNVSKNPRACAENNSWPSACDKNWPTQWRRNDAGDFWVSGPIEDVNPELRDLVVKSAQSAAPRLSGRGRLQVSSVSRGIAVQCFGMRNWEAVLIDCKGAEICRRRSTGTIAYLPTPHAAGTYVLTVATPQGQRVQQTVIAR